MAALGVKATTVPITSAGATAALDISNFDAGATIEVQGITTGTVQMQLSLDGTVWVDEGSALTADGRLVLVGLAAQVRGNVTVDTDVTVIIVVAGRESPLITGTFA